MSPDAYKKNVQINQEDCTEKSLFLQLILPWPLKYTISSSPQLDKIKFFLS